LASRSKPFVGAALARRSALLDPNRPRLVGLESVDADQRLSSGAILFAPSDPIKGHGRGRITSTTYSSTLGRWIALGLYAGGMSNANKEILAVFPIKNEVVRVRVVSPIFLDPAGERLRG
jgi:sarcosine oxidase subunit alpha